LYKLKRHVAARRARLVGLPPRAARRLINIPTLQSYRLWSLLSARQEQLWRNYFVKLLGANIYHCLQQSLPWERDYPAHGELWSRWRWSLQYFLWLLYLWADL